MILSYLELRSLQDNGIIENSLPEHVNSASIDITLGPQILCERSTPFSIIDLWRRQPLNTTLYTLTDDKVGYVPRATDIPFYCLDPGELILAQSQQVFNLPNWLSAEYKLKSSMARMGIDHANAGWCDAGWHGSVLTLELKNISRYHSVRLRLGDKIGQMVFYKHAVVPSDASYANRGKYNNDKQTTGAKSE